MILDQEAISCYVRVCGEKYISLYYLNHYLGRPFINKPTLLTNYGHHTTTPKLFLKHPMGVLNAVTQHADDLSRTSSSSLKCTKVIIISRSIHLSNRHWRNIGMKDSFLTEFESIIINRVCASLIFFF